MAFDGIMTRAMVKELKDTIVLGRIDKIYQPEKEELVFHIHTKAGNVKLFASAGSLFPRIHFIEESPLNPPEPSAFCMLMRKHLQGGRIISVEQKNCERIIEISLETLNELGFTVSRKLIFEIMGKHSNIVLVDMSDNRIIDSIKRVSIDTSRVRQILPGKTYEYPPAQDKVDFDKVTEEYLEQLPKDRKVMLSSIGGISPAISRELAVNPEPYRFLRDLIEDIDSGRAMAHIYKDDEGKVQEYHVAKLWEYEDICVREDFPDVSSCINAFYERKDSSNRVKQRSHQLTKTVGNLLDKLYLKLQRLNEDLLNAENSEDLRLYGELLTANLHLAKTGDSQVTVVNYYNGEKVSIPLDPKYSPSKNAQNYFKKYGKAKTAIKEKQIQIDETQGDIDYLESVLTYLENTNRVEDVETLRYELVETGYLRKRKQNFKEKRFKARPYKYRTPSGHTVLAGRNNRENDVLTLKTGVKTDYWFHTKDIPGSHVLMQMDGQEPTEEDIFFAAAIAAYHSKGRNSENVPVDYVPIRYVKKPAGSKPGMVIFTNNRTVWVNPAVPEEVK